jgi:hypothetical protein
MCFIQYVHRLLTSAPPHTAPQRQYPESFDPAVPSDLAYSGTQHLTTPVGDLLPEHKELTWVQPLR